ncbi:hypothetical protein AN641_10175 [Candidatus Epulonipiscioides gigas]|nr:hypothetical protein AN641_10175 [Epulopiscium sp. SCG-C07WGA-EpuloA2]
MLKEKLEKLVNELVANGHCKSEDKEIVIYGLSTAIELTFNIITMLVLGALFDLLLETVIFLVSFSLIRIYAGGYHCQKSINCYFFSTALFLLILTILKFTSVNYIFIISIVLICISVPIILKFAPVETPTKLLDNDEIKYFRKKTVFNLIAELIVVSILFFYNLYYFSYIICLGITLSSITIIIEIFRFKTKV